MTIAMVDYGSLPAVRIDGPGGAQAVVTLFGAHLVSWKASDGQERLFCSAKSSLDGTRAIRGGVPVIFPQFAARGSGMRHGFARVSTWTLTESGDDGSTAFARFVLDAGALDPALARAWPHGFSLALLVELHAHQLQLTLDVANTGTDAFAFSAALHTYFLVDQVANVRIGGLEDLDVGITDKFDHIYFGAGDALAFRSGIGALELEQEGFTDVVVWNPGQADTAALADMEGSDYERFVCIEPALLEPAVLEPGRAWRGRHRIGIR